MVSDGSMPFAKESVPDNLKLPGSAASSIRVPAFLNSLPRWLLSVRCGFQGFLRSILMNPERSSCSTCTTSPLWPMPLPFPEVFRKGATCSVAMAHVKRLVSMQIAVLNWFVLGRPLSSPDAIRLGRSLSSRQWTVVRRLQDLVVDGNTPEFIDAGDMGRSASKNEDQEKALDALCRAVSMAHVFDGYFGGNSCRPGSFDDSWLRCGKLVGRLQCGNVCNAKPIVSDRLTVPDEPRFDPLPHFDRRTAYRYEHPISGGRLPSEVDLPPMVQIRASKEEKLRLLCKLAGAGMLKPIESDSFHQGFENGMFAVNKDAVRDRLVLDSRASNMLDRGQSVWSGGMASAMSLCSIYVDDDRVLLSSGEDLKDYFYQFRVNKERTSRNALKTALNADEFRVVFGRDPPSAGNVFHVGLSTLAMGDICAVEYAQCSHISLCLKHQVFCIDEMISLKGAIPRGLLQAGIIVDDLVILEHVLREKFDSSDLHDTEGSKRTANARDAYDKSLLPHNPKKGFCNSAHCRYWGVEVDGVKGLIRCSSLRLWPTSVITLRVCSLGVATVGLIEALAGSWVSLLGVRRRLYSAMETIFEPLGIPDQKAVVRLSSELKSELMCLVVLGSLAVVNLRSKPSNFIVATDASMDAMAGVTAEVHPCVVKEITRYSLKKGNWSRLLPATAAWERSHGLLDAADELPGDSFKCNPLWDTVASCFEYKTTWIKKVDKAKHINLLELQSYITEEKRLAHRYSSLRIPAGIDSQVCLGAVVKGRASSAAINAILRQSMPYSIGADLYMHYMYYPSELNRSDGPTRNRPPAPPSIAQPLWVRDLPNGCFKSFDVWMMTYCRDMVVLPMPVDEVGGHSDIDLTSQRRQRDLRFFERLKSSRTVKSSTLEHSPAANLPPQQLPKRPSPLLQSDDGSLPGCLGVERCPTPSLPSGDPSSISKSDRFDDVADEVSMLPQEALDILYSFSKSQFFFKDKLSLQFPGGLDLFSGRCGVAMQMISFGCPWVLTFDYERGPGQDLLDESLRKKLVRLIQLRAVASFGAAPICSSFSIAITPPIRSAAHPRGIRGLRASMRKKVADGNSHNDFMKDLIDLCVRLQVPFWLENPDSSWWWRQRRWRRYRDSRSPHLFRCCFCRFGTKWRKATRFATSTALAGVTMWCQCGDKRHIPLRGMHPTKKIPWTLVAQPYPRGLCRLVAAALCVSAGWCGPEKLNVVGCSKTLSLRIGEASHPGPARGLRSGTLEELPTQRPETLAREAKLLQAFLQWCQDHFTGYSAENLFELLPQFMAMALRRYGDLMYQTGGALSNLRHLLLAAQRWKPIVRPHMQQAWEMVERWECLNPTVHRNPVPEVIVKAMCCLAWHWGWHTWVGATILSFYGAGRVGEVLRCSREDLLLPSDVLEPPGSAVFLRLRTFKSKNRQPARVQHMRVSDATASRIVSRIFRKMQMEQPLFDSTSYQYRKRWDLVAETLGFSKPFTLTPGGLRGGAAVYHYRMGKPIQDLLWLLRLRSQATLEHYLQEVASLNILAKLPPKDRQSILSIAATFPFLAAATSLPGSSEPTNVTHQSRSS